MIQYLRAFIKKPLLSHMKRQKEYLPSLCFNNNQSIKVPYPSYERGRLYKRIFDMPTCLVLSGLSPTKSGIELTTIPYCQQ